MDTDIIEDVCIEETEVSETGLVNSEAASVPSGSTEGEETPNWLAKVLGQPVNEMPEDLYIPPEALRVFLETFEGPLDLLLYLIRKQNIDILNIPIASITQQYVEYVELMKDFNLELAGEYLVMAAVLAEIKSRMLLPRQPGDEPNEEEDPRAELVRRLQEYELFKHAAEALDEIPRQEREIFPVNISPPVMEVEEAEPEVSLEQLLSAFKLVLKRAKNFQHHHIELEVLSLREKMTQILGRLNENEFTEFPDLFIVEEGRLGIVVSFISLLELLKQAMIELVQNEPFAPIYVRRVSNE